MKTLLHLVAMVIIASNTMIAQVAQHSNPTATDPAIQSALQVATQFMDLAYSRDFRDAENMMNPEPPKWDKGRSELRNLRMGQIKRQIESREALGDISNREAVGMRKINMSERLPEEEFFHFNFKTTFADGRTVGDQVTVLKKNGMMCVERFMY